MRTLLRAAVLALLVFLASLIVEAEWGWFASMVLLLLIILRALLIVAVAVLALLLLVGVDLDGPKP